MDIFELEPSDLPEHTNQIADEIFRREINEVVDKVIEDHPELEEGIGKKQ